MARRQTVLLFCAAAVAVVVGIYQAAARFPGGFDWAYTVISKLASRTHNPEGGAWLSGGTLAAMLLLWPVASRLDAGAGARRAVLALRIGLAGGILLALEGLFIVDLSGMMRKGHEALALLTFAGLYAGVLGLHVHRARDGGAARWPMLAVIVPLAAVGLSQVALYFDQRDLGWVDTAWRELGVPLWLSFAFWQWLAVAMLGMGLAHLVAAPSRGVGAECARTAVTAVSMAVAPGTSNARSVGERGRGTTGDEGGMR